VPEPASSAPLPLSVWPTAQQPAASQRTGRYLPGSTAHPAKMLPAIARQAIAAYSQPGDLVLDPMCGIGTTLVEAIHLGRDAIGIELEARWAALASANTAHARSHGATGTAQVITGDARHLPDLLDPNLAGKVALVLTSPPYGRSVHGQVTARPGRGVAKFDDTYSADPANLGRVNQPTLLKALQQILANCQQLLAPDGLLVLTARPYRHRDHLVDLPGQLTQVAEATGLMLYERNAALLVGLREDRLVPRPSFFQLNQVRKARTHGLPLRIIAHEEVLVFRWATNGSLLVRVEGRGVAPGRRQRRQAAVAAAGAVALATTTASSAPACSRGSARPAPGATPSATTDLRPVPPR
jgi:modification methylase